MAEPKRKATYADVLAAPENTVAEIIDGELILSPRPAYRHTNASSVLGFEIGGRFHGPPGDRDRPGGWLILVAPELHLGDDVVVPDVAGWRRDRMPCDADARWFDVAPDWVGETLSPSTARIDRGRKLALYARAGVAHVWFVDPLARTLEILRLCGGGTFAIAAVHADTDKPRAEPFEALELELTRLWLD